MRILASNEYFYQSVGGAERVLNRLIEGMLSRGDIVTVCSFEKNNSIVRGKGLTHYNFVPRGPLDYSISALRSLDKFSKFDIVFSQHYYHFSSLFASLVSRRHDIPLILKPIGIYGGNGMLRDLAYDFVDSTQGIFSLKRAFLIVPTTRFEARMIESKGIPKERIRVIPSGIDPIAKPAEEEINHFRSRYLINERDKLVLFVGRIEKSKGVDILLDAIYSLKDEFKQLKCLLVGPVDPKFAKAMSKQIGNLKDQLILTGPIHGADLASSYHTSCMFCLPSRSELASLSLREAGSARLPVVATKVGGNPEFVIDGKTGFLIPPEDSRCLAEKIARLLSDSTLRESMGETGREFSTIQTTEKYVRETLDAIDSALIDAEAS